MGVYIDENMILITTKPTTIRFELALEGNIKLKHEIKSIITDNDAFSRAKNKK